MKKRQRAGGRRQKEEKAKVKRKAEGRRK